MNSAHPCTSFHPTLRGSSRLLGQMCGPVGNARIQHGRSGDFFSCWTGADRGGRRKRFFKLTKAGRKVLDETMELRLALYKKLPKLTLEEVFTEYGYALFVVAICGGFGNCPTVATSNTMYAIGADGLAPQLGSVLLLVIFYITDFQLVQYIPKAAFSALLVLVNN